ncbi:hypothetical protein [Nonomuraea dietziae]
MPPNPGVQQGAAKPGVQQGAAQARAFSRVPPKPPPFRASLKPRTSAGVV